MEFRNTKKDRENTEKIIESAVKSLEEKGVIIFPTDTVYGLGTYYANPEGIEKIYEIKKRDKKKALVALISNKKYLDRLIDPEDMTPVVKEIIGKYWPGELTIIFNALKTFYSDSFGALAGLTTIGIRIPKNETALKIIEEAGGILFVTSANISGEENPDSIKKISFDVLKKVDFIVNEGKLSSVGIPSTILRVSGNSFEILREGNVKKEEIQKFFKEG